MTGYCVTYEQDPEGSCWLVHVDDMPRAHTYGRTIRQARANIAEVIALWEDIDPQDVEIVTESFVGPILAAAQRARDAREEAKRAEEAATDAVLVAAHGLIADGVSLRDAADILGISHQRVHQLVGSGRADLTVRDPLTGRVSTVQIASARGAAAASKATPVRPARSSRSTRTTPRKRADRT